MLRNCAHSSCHDDVSHPLKAGFWVCSAHLRNMTYKNERALNFYFGAKREADNITIVILKLVDAISRSKVQHQTDNQFRINPLSIGWRERLVSTRNDLPK